MQQTKQLVKARNISVKKLEMADAHCHIDLIQDFSIVTSAIESGVSTIVTNAVDTKSIMKTLQLADNKHVFAAVGIDPEHSLKMEENTFDEEINFVVNIIKEHSRSIVAIGEIGLDYKIVGGFENMAKQRDVFERFLDLAQSLRLPVSVHSRNAMKDVISILKERKQEKVHVHFFEGDAKEAKTLEKLGYYISIPPLDSSKRKRVVKNFDINMIMPESDSPVVGESPMSVEKSIRLVAEAKGMDFEKAAQMLTDNVKRFFNISSAANVGLIRY